MSDGDNLNLIRTKLNTPRVSGDLLVRSHLIESLNEGFNRKLTLISAPASFGKTTLAATIDQAALHGLLRRLYSMGLPLISVICMEVSQADKLAAKTKIK